MSITLSSVILHRMDHTKELLSLSYELTEVDPVVQITLCDQILRNRGSGRAQQHKFDANEASVVDSAFAAILEKPDDRTVFIDQSQHIALRLYESMKGNVTPGDLLICLFRDGSEAPWLALLKIPPMKGYAQNSVGSEETHDLQIKLNEATILTSGALQKCAFIAPPDLRTEHRDLIVLDRQIGKHGDENSVALFFVKVFLQCVVLPTPRQITFAFERGVKKFVRDNLNALGQDAANAIIAAIAGEVAKLRVDIDEFAASQIPPGVLREMFPDALLANGLPVRVFEPEMAAPSPPPPSSIFTGDNGLTLEIQKSAVAAEKYTKDDDAVPESVTLYEIESFGGKRRFVIVTTSWHEVTGE